MKLLDFLFPNKCIGCFEVMEDSTERAIKTGNDALCMDCRGKYERAKLKPCAFCGKPMIDCRCAPWRLSEFGCNRLYKLCEYSKDIEDPQMNMMTSLKKHGLRRTELFFSGQLAMLLRTVLSEFPNTDFCITSLPRSRYNKAAYGYDHAETVARAAAEMCGIEYVKMLKRRFLSTEQKRLNAEERERNMSRAFRLTPEAECARGKVIIVFDDMITTGASFGAALELLTDNEFYDLVGACIMVAERRKRRSGHS